ncbi:peptidoglycan DD-metalloendopeptidase family protein [Tropicimonas isoalkanivorans]|uniref:Murein DD-endopeptidase MepM and murein hydrolase activator NlpD, contain LysM domain n=1 Tax=Tropicimonas isoalkanivorans TaxID=441112 RepID=A0A1I1KDH4_9RHOB|nr:peptidoglycan DD-metalloendopeptidase family protein [Tropicimonas isoalkanivorans]SFC56768.1 Murein DD-endopeptidase MepM and murein hydrolase activator NlpD, contain LysM domain [Tropicimonas isoalkanivorans]
MRPTLSLCASMLVLSACSTGSLSNFDLDFRGIGSGFDTTDAVAGATTSRPQPDNRGVISYPNYQVAIARRNDTVADVAARLGTVPAEELARYNGVPVNARLNQGEVLALPRRVSEPSPATGAIGTGPIRPAGSVDVETLAGGAIDRAGAGTSGASAIQTGREPVRHQVQPGETAYSIARRYGVTPAALAEWNGLDAGLNVRSGQYLLIPVLSDSPAARPQIETATTAPGQGSPTPTPPSAATPLPKNTPPAAAKETPETPKSPDLGKQATSVSKSRMGAPVGGSIIRDFNKGKNDGIDIAASSGETVRAAAGGVVAAITEDTDNVPILVLRHDGGLLTVYANVDNLKVRKGDRVDRGQAVATVRSSSSPYLHFEVREGVEAVDPTPYLN